MGKRRKEATTYDELRRQTARMLGQPLDALVTRHVTLLRLCLRNIEIRLLRGDKIDPGDAVRLNDALREYLPNIEKPLEVKIEIVDSLPREPLPPLPDPPPSTPPTDSDDKPEVPPAAALPAAASNVVPLRQQRMGVSESAFHDQVLPDGSRPPLKRLQAGGGGYYSGNANVFAAGPAPDVERGHALPDWDVVPR